MERGDYMNHKKKINNFFYGANNKVTKIQFLSGNAIKIIAICLMFFDHFNKTILLWLFKQCSIQYGRNGKNIDRSCCKV